MELPADDVEPALRKVLFVCTSATEVGLMGRALRAAAAAADESEELEAWFLMNTDVAAMVAAGFAVWPLRGCYESHQRVFLMMRSTLERAQRLGSW
jgi:hypothetical protein